MSDQTKRNIWIGSVLMVGLLAVGYSWLQSKPDEPPNLIPVRFASVPAVIEAPSHVAYKNGYFEAEGLDLTMEINPDGKTSLDHLMDDQVDIAAVMSTPVIYKSFERDDFYIISQIGRTELIHSAVARRDSGISSAEDLRGKRVAVMFGTSGHFFMDTWLLYQGLKPSDMEVINLNGPDSVEAIKKGEIDAMFCWFPFPKIAEAELGDNAFVFSNDNVVTGSWLVIAKKEYVHQNPEVLERFLRAIYRAESFIREDTDAALKIYTDVAGLDEEIAATIFDQMVFSLSLEQSLLLDLEDQARWIIDYGYTDQVDIPNYLDYVYPDALLAVNPEAVRIILEQKNDD